MLQRLYIDNFHCLVNFELRLGPINLLLGANGSGKSSVFDALRRLQDFLIGGARVHDSFPSRSLTRWDTRSLQSFELELLDADHPFTYRLVIEHDRPRQRMRVQEERLSLRGQNLFASEGGQAQLYRDDFSPGPQYPLDWSLSGLGALHERPDNQLLSRFKRALARLVLLRPVPQTMASESRSESLRLDWQAQNFVSWYRRAAQEYLGANSAFLTELGQVLPAFESLSIRQSGEDTRVLKAWFAAPAGGRLEIDFSELSDGQKQLILLYALLYVLREEKPSLFIDEPDNFVALREIQPWLAQLSDAIGSQIEQTVLISHHPELINHLGQAHGQWLWREGSGPVRVSAAPAATDGLNLSETLAREWHT